MSDQEPGLAKQLAQRVERLDQDLQESTARITELEAMNIRLEAIAKKPHPYGVTEWEVEKYEGEWTVFAKGHTNPLVSTLVREYAERVCDMHNEGIGYLQAVVAAWREREVALQEREQAYLARRPVDPANVRVNDNKSRLVELDQIETPEDGCYLKLKESE